MRRTSRAARRFPERKPWWRPSARSWATGRWRKRWRRSTPTKRRCRSARRHRLEGGRSSTAWIRRRVWLILRCMKKPTSYIVPRGVVGWKSTPTGTRKRSWRQRMRRWMRFGVRWTRCIARTCRDAGEETKRSVVEVVVLRRQKRHSGEWRSRRTQEGRSMLRPYKEQPKNRPKGRPLQKMMERPPCGGLFCLSRECSLDSGYLPSVVEGGVGAPPPGTTLL